MPNTGYFTLIALLAAASVSAQEADSASDAAATTDATDAVEEESAAKPVTVAAATPDQPRAMSGMSILGNEEAPKALVIIPWKSSELGDELGMPEHLDDRATPVDREVFLRELHFYDIRRGDE